METTILCIDNYIDTVPGVEITLSFSKNSTLKNRLTEIFSGEFELRFTKTPTTGLSIIREDPNIQLVLLETHYPNFKDGFVLARKIRALRPNLNMIFLTDSNLHKHKILAGQKDIKLLHKSTLYDELANERFINLANNLIFDPFNYDWDISIDQSAGVFSLTNGKKGISNTIRIPRTRSKKQFSSKWEKRNYSEMNKNTAILNILDICSAEPRCCTDIRLIYGIPSKQDLQKYEWDHLVNITLQANHIINNLVFEKTDWRVRKLIHKGKCVQGELQMLIGPSLSITDNSYLKFDYKKKIKELDFRIAQLEQLYCCSYAAAVE